MDSWPIFGLRLRIGDLELRPVREADLEAMTDLLPADLELDPSATSYAGITDLRVARGVVTCQSYWKSLGTWSPEAWRLQLAVRLHGELIGMQELEGNDFPVLRTVDSSSWLVQRARGHGYGKQMRRAVLALAFGPLGAEAAITSAWQDNYASLAVSRALGYAPNGVSMLNGGDWVGLLQHLRLVRADWLASGQAGEVGIEGFEPCRPFFGLD